jgi:prepilin-type N-terminal cleavage/methylation domain-containing protein
MIKKRAFTLVEVLFAVVLLSVIGMAILQSSSNNSKLMNYSMSKINFIHLSSIFSINMNDDLHNKSKTFYDLIQKKYSLDDETRKELKKVKYTLRSDDIEQIVLQDSDASSNSIIFNIKKHTISGKFNYYDYSMTSDGL